MAQLVNEFPRNRAFSDDWLAWTNLCMGALCASRSRACSTSLYLLGEINFQKSNIFGVWLSLVERLVRDQEVGRSNRLTPTKTKSTPRECFLFCCGWVRFDSLFALRQKWRAPSERRRGELVHQRRAKCYEQLVAKSSCHLDHYWLTTDSLLKNYLYQTLDLRPKFWYNNVEYFSHRRQNTVVFTLPD